MLYLIAEIRHCQDCTLLKLDQVFSVLNNLKIGECGVQLFQKVSDAQGSIGNIQEKNVWAIPLYGNINIVDSQFALL